MGHSYSKGTAHGAHPAKASPPSPEQTGYGRGHGARSTKAGVGPKIAQNQNPTRGLSVGKIGTNRMKVPTPSSGTKGLSKGSSKL